MRKINNGRYLQTYRRYQSTKIENLDSRVNEALSSNNDDALFILGETLYNFGLTPQGLEVFRTLYHKYPDESELLIYFIEGLMSENQTDEALEYLAQVEPSTEKLMLEADLYQQINMLEVAIDKLQEALDLEPNDPIIHFALAELLYYDGQYLRATREYETVLETGEYEVNGVNIFREWQIVVYKVVIIQMLLAYLMKLMKKR